MDVVRVKAGGKDRPVFFGNRAMALFARETGASFGSVSRPINDWEVDLLFAMLWAGLAAGAQKRGEEFDVTPLDVADWCDDPKVLQEMLRAFQAAQPKPEDEAEPAGNVESR